MEPRKKCIVCEGDIHRSNTKKGVKERRAQKCVTCSRKCSKIYTRVYQYVRILKNK